MDIEDVDPGTLLEWMDGNLSIQDDERALQANALERLCMLLLMSNNVDRCFETYSPDVFVPALCRIFLDAKSPTYVLEATARAITYFLDISIECSHRITNVEGALPAISKRLVLCDAFSDRTDIDLAEQCIKILDRMSSVDSNINVATSYLVEILDKHWQKLHNDSILSALKVVYRICTNQDHFIDNIPLPDMRPLFNSSNPIITDKILACLPFLYKRGAKLPDPLPDKLLLNPQLLSVMCRYVPSIDAEFVLKAYTPDSSLDVSIADTLLFCIFEKDMLIPVDDYRKVDDKLAQSCINYIMQTEEPFPPSIAFDSRLLNWTDKHGHSLLCWAAALGSNFHVKQILQAGDNPTKAIHIAACSGKLDNFKSLIEAGANFECLDDNGRNVMALAEERMKGSIAQFLRFAPVFWKPRKNIKSSSSLDLLPFFKPLLSIDFSQISALRLLLRFCHFWNAESVSSLLSSDPKIPAKIADILLQNLLSSKLNGEKTLITLEICKTLIEKHSSHFQSLFIRLGIVERITKLLEQADDNEMLDCKDIIFPPNQPDRQFIVATITPTHGIRSRIAMRILRMKPFSWGEWFIVVTSDHGYVWNRFVVLEFNRSSSFGTYHCFKDNMLYSVDSRKNSIQYGCTTLIDSLDQYVLFMDRFAFARNAAMLAPYETSASNESSEPVTPSTPAIPDYMSPVHTDSLSSAQEINSEESPIFPNNDDVDSAQPPPFTSTKLLGPWSMLYNANDLSQPATITHDTKTEQVISLTATDGTYFSFNVYGKDFKIGCETALRLCSESHTQQCASSATSNTQHNSSTDNNRNPAQVKSACFQKQSFDLATWLSDYFLKLNKSAIIDPVRLLNENYLIDLKKNAHILLDMLKNRKFTHFELISSNLSSCLLNSSVEHIFDAYRNHPGIIVLIETFISQLDELIDDVSDGDDWPIAANNRNYASISSSSNGTSETRSSRQAIRLLGNLVRMRIVSANSEDGQMSVENLEWMDDRKRLICNSRSIATINPFICIEQLSDQLSSKYLCSWYQDSRNNLHFIKKIQKLSTIEFKLSEPKSSAQSGGIINWVATNAGCCKWIDPLKANLMKVYSNKHRYSNRHRSQKLYSQSGIYSVRVCTQSSENDHSSSSSSQHSNSNRLFFQLDTGLYVRPNSYKITCSNVDGKLKRPLKWTLLVSNDAKNWSKADIVMIVQIENGLYFSMAEFDQSSDVFKRGCRHFRLEQFKTEPGVNAEYTFDLKNFELYGTIIGACKKDLDHLSAMQRLTQTISRERRTGERFTLRIPRHLTSTIRGLHQNAVEQQLRALEAVTLELSSHNSALSRSNSHEVGTTALQELLFTCNRRAMYLQSALSTESSTNPHTPLEISASPSRELEDTQDNEVEVNNITDVTNEQHPTSNKALTFLTDDELLRQSSMTNSGENQLQDLQNTSDQHQTTSLDANEFFADLELRRSDVMRMILNEGEESILDSDVEMDDELDIRDAVDSYADEVDTQNDDEQDCDDEGNTSDDYEDNQCDDDSLGEVDDEEQEEEEDNDELFAEIDAHELHEFSNSLGGINVMIERKSRALLPAYDPRPGQNNVSSTQDIDMDTITKYNKEHKDHRRQKKLDDNQQLLIKLELNSQHPDVQKLKIPTLHQTLKRKSKKCLYWYMRKILSRLDTKERNEISKHTWEKLFRLKLELIDLQQSRDSCNSECDEDYDDDTLRFSKEKMQILSGDYTKIIKQLFAMLSKPDCKFDLSYFHYSRLIALIDKLLLDPLTVASGTHPSWIDEILKQMPFLVSFNTRLRYFRALSFGTTRSLIWILQDSDFIREFNVARFIGRLKKERCTLRRNYLLRDACELLEYHSLHKSELELVWKDEDGTGLGPTMEFYTLLTAELLRKDLGLWLVDENSSSSTHVNNPFGLFPAPYPRDHWKLIEVCRLFHLLGILIAKCLQDNRQCSELNLSDPLLKLLCPPVQMRYVPINKRISLSLDYEDFCKIQPERARIFKHLAGKNLDDMCLTFNYAPSNQFYGYTECRLGSHKSFDPVTASNLKEYIKEITNFVLRDGVAMQIKALLYGISKVMPLESLYCFTSEELKSIICGDQSPSWTRDILLKHIEPKNGYNRDSPMYLYLIDVLLSLQNSERSDVLQFITGCRTLPVGGLAALVPPLTVAKKDGYGYPSVNTCNHFLKLPEYATLEELKEKLLISCKEKGFYFN